MNLLVCTAVMQCSMCSVCGAVCFIPRYTAQSLPAYKKGIRGHDIRARPPRWLQGCGETSA